LVVQVAQTHSLHCFPVRVQVQVLAQVLVPELERELHLVRTLAHSNHPIRSPASLVLEHKGAKINRTPSRLLRNR
jgi:hypothetical protein